MGLLRKLKEFGSAHILPLLDGRPAGGDADSALDLDYGPLPQSFFDAVHSAREGPGREPIPVLHPHKPMHRRDKRARGHEVRPEFGAFDRAPRRGSPDQLRRPLPGTPIKFRRRAISPEMLRPSNSAPSLFGQHPQPTSPDMLSHYQHGAQGFFQPQHQQFDRRPAPPPAAPQFYPQFQAPLYPTMYPQAPAPNWFMMPQRQPGMYPFF